MDYRELENRMARNQDMIKERAYDRLIEEAKKANVPQTKRMSLLARLRSFFTSVKPAQVEPEPQIQIKPRHQLKPH
jgi:hypothetical protein